MSRENRSCPRMAMPESRMLRAIGRVKCITLSLVPGVLKPSRRPALPETKVGEEQR